MNKLCYLLLNISLFLSFSMGLFFLLVGVDTAVWINSFWGLMCTLVSVGTVHYQLCMHIYIRAER